MQVKLGQHGPMVLVDKPKQYDNRGRELDFKEPFNPIQSAKEQGEDALNDFIAEVESHMDSQLAKCTRWQRDAVAATYQAYINRAAALKNDWLKQCEEDMEVEKDD